MSDVTSYLGQAIVTDLSPDVVSYLGQALFTPEDIEFTDFRWSWLPSYVQVDTFGWTPLFAPSLMDTDPPERLPLDP